MKNTKLNYLLLFLVFFYLSSPAFSEETKNEKWLQISGKWETRKDNKDTFLLEAQGKTKLYGYNELLDYNSIITFDPITSLTAIKFNIEIRKTTIEGAPELMTFFAAKNYRQFYAFKFIGNENKIIRILFINSGIKDTTKPGNEKWNYEITEMASKDYELEFNKEYNFEIQVSKKRARLFINGKNVMEAEGFYDLSGGKIGFSDRNAMLRISQLSIVNNKTIVFEDSFAEDNIKRYVITAKQLTKAEYEKQEKNKQKKEKEDKDKK